MLKSCFVLIDGILRRNEASVLKSRLAAASCNHVKVGPLSEPILADLMSARLAGSAKRSNGLHGNYSATHD